ncbi:MAG: TRAP transporter TatT component family protein [Bacteroidota bacterium]
MSKQTKHSCKWKCIFAGAFLYSCTSFNHGWDSLVEKQSNENPDVIFERAMQLEKTASDAKDIELLLMTLKDVEKADPGYYNALWRIGNYHILMGAAFSKNKKEQKYHYREAVKYCEKAMFTNNRFKSEVLKDVDIIEAAKYLTEKEIDAMGYWYTARFYYFKDCLSPIGRAFNTKIVIENNKIIELIDSIDPNWAGGGNYFSRALYYIALPERFGGSKERAADEFKKAIEVGPNYLVNRWGRAKYLYSVTNNMEGFVSDLEWVINQDPHKADNPYPWNVYFQNDAEKMLKKVGEK